MTSKRDSKADAANYATALLTDANAAKTALLAAIAAAANDLDRRILVGQLPLADLRIARANEFLAEAARLKP